MRRAVFLCSASLALGWLAGGSVGAIAAPLEPPLPEPIPAPRAGSAADLRLVDMVVVQVDATVITLSELIGEARLVVLRARGPELARTAALGQDLLNAVLASMVTRELLLGEVRRLQLREVPEDEIEAAMDGLRRRFSAPGDFARFLERIGLREREESDNAVVRGPRELAAILRAELQVERFIALRVGTGGLIRDAEVLRCYDARREELGRRPLATVRPLIERTLREAQSEAQLKGLIAQLEKKAVVHYAPGYRLESLTAKPAGEVPLGLRCPEPAR